LATFVASKVELARYLVRSPLGGFDGLSPWSFHPFGLTFTSVTRASSTIIKIKKMVKSELFTLDP
jgi:hypothetical protein